MPGNFPLGAEEVWDVVAKALLLDREGGIVIISRDELERAAKAECTIRLLEDGSLLFQQDSIKAN